MGRPITDCFRCILLQFILTPAVRLLSFRSPFCTYSEPQSPPGAKEFYMDISERRQLTRFPLRTPIRFKAMGLAADNSEHFTEALNVSQGGFYFATSAPLQIGMPIEATLRMPAEITGDKPKETHCRARVVHSRNEPYGDGRIGFGAEIETFVSMPGPDRWTNQTRLL
jgi:hypothetical protein